MNMNAQPKHIAPAILPAAAFTNTVNSAVTAIDAKTGEVKGRLVLDDRKRTEEVRPLQPRELVADDATNTVYISGIGKDQQ